MAYPQILNRWARPIRLDGLARPDGQHTRFMLWLASAASLGLVAVCAYVVTHAH